VFTIFHTRTDTSIFVHLDPLIGSNVHIHRHPDIRTFQYSIYKSPKAQIPELSQEYDSAGTPKWVTPAGQCPRGQDDKTAELEGL
jgi:hypothetical protein